MYLRGRHPCQLAIRKGRVRISLGLADLSIAYIVKQALALDLPRRMQMSFYKVVQERSEVSGKEMTSKDITTAFRQTYHLGGSIFDGRIVLKSFVTTDLRPSVVGTPEMRPQSRSSSHSRMASLSLSGTLPEPSPDRSDDLPSAPKRITAKVFVDGKIREISGEGNGPLSSILDALHSDLGITLSIREYTEHGVGTGSDVKAATYVELIPSNVDPKDKTKGGFWGVGVDADITASGLKAVMSAANGALGEGVIKVAEI
jgi:2-isopropylmalate synthase